MELHLDDRTAAFRQELLVWLAKTVPPPGLRDYGLTPTAADVQAGRAWQAMLADGGWSCLHWPERFGGRGASVAEQAIFAEVMAEASRPTALSIVGPDLAGPLIIAEGTPEQHDRFLEPIRRGEHLWCQLFSEPNAGSDLASLATRATPTPGGWAATGQKIWTSAGHLADYGLLMARTDRDVPAHAGITLFLVPMDRPGITVRPLIQMDGEYKFNEVFLDDLALAPEDVLGSVGGGWRIATSMLGRERLTLGAHAVGYRRALDRLRTLARDTGQETRLFRQRWAALASRVFLLRATWIRALSGDADPGGPAMATLKVLSTELQRDVSLLAEGVLGPALIAGDSAAEWAARLLVAPGARIAGGTSEIQRNILAERVLGLPREPRPAA
jgi:alkylation response protein AidB-like acyl-CoA dehydrogenase